MSSFLRARDEASFGRLYRLHSPLLFRVILRSLGRPDVAEDVLQETWLRAVSALPSFRWESSLRTWLTGIAIRCCQEARRAPRAATAESQEWFLQAPAGDSRRIDLERAVAELAPGRREVLLLHDVEGFTHAEVAALLDIDEGTSKSQLSRAREQLRRRLEGDAVPRRPKEVETDGRA